MMPDKAECCGIRQGERRMNIQYGCVTMRALERKDMAMLLAILNDPDVENMMAGWSFPMSEENQMKWFEHFDPNKELRCMIDVVNGATIGTIGLVDIDWKNRKAELFYKVVNDIEKRVKGDVNDATMGILAYAFDELNMHCITGLTLEKNIFSQKMLKKCGFTQEGVLRKRIYKKGEYWNQVNYSILKEEFEEKRATEAGIEK